MPPSELLTYFYENALFIYFLNLRNKAINRKCIGSYILDYKRCNFLSSVRMAEHVSSKKVRVQ